MSPGLPARPRVMTSIAFPGESAAYRAARDALLAQEARLRQATEAVAAARRELPGGIVPEDYAFQGLRADGEAGDVRLSELFGPGQASLALYSFMFPATRATSDPGPTAATARCCPSRRGRARRARRCWTSSTGRRSTSASGWASPSSPRRRCPGC